MAEYTEEEIKKMNEEVSSLGQGNHYRPMEADDIKTIIGESSNIDVVKLNDVEARAVFDNE